MLKLDHIFVAPGHSYFGRHGQPAALFPVVERSEAECVAGRGLRGDRFFDCMDDYTGQVTLFAAEVFERLCEELKLTVAQPAALRRNLLVRGGDLIALIGEEFDLQGVRLADAEECRPCYWMDQALAPGVEAWLKGRGGVRCRVLTSGGLRREA